MSGLPAPFPVYPVLGKGLTLRGYTVSEVVRDPSEVEVAKSHILSRLADGRYTPRVARAFAVDDFRDAYRYIESNEALGRVVVEFP